MRRHNDDAMTTTARRRQLLMGRCLYPLPLCVHRVFTVCSPDLIALIAPP